MGPMWVLWTLLLVLYSLSSARSQIRPSDVTNLRALTTGACVQSFVKTNIAENSAVFHGFWQFHKTKEYGYTDFLVPYPGSNHDKYWRKIITQWSMKQSIVFTYFPLWKPCLAKLITGYVAIFLMNSNIYSSFIINIFFRIRAGFWMSLSKNI